MTLVVLFVLGLIVGSFLNVIGLRLNSGMTLASRSVCPTCGKKLKWFELVPVLSFLILRGRCRGCHTKISWQYPTIEILTGLVFVTLYSVTGLTTYYLLLTTTFCLYIVITIYDLRHKIIPDGLVYLTIALALIYRISTCYLFIPSIVEGLPATYYLDFLAGPIIFAFFAFIWFFSRGRAMGFGDAKLGLSLGLLLGASVGFSAVVMAFWIGAGSMLLVMVLRGTNRLLTGAKKLTMKSEIPFAPFLVLGAWISFVWQLDLLNVFLLSQ